MTVRTDVTEIADSEEEPLTSSPAAVSDPAANKLSTTARQDAQAVACPCPEPTGHPTNEHPNCTDRLHVNQEKPSRAPETAHIDHSDLQPVHQTETNGISTCTTKADLLPSHASLDAAGIDKQSGRVNERRGDSEDITQEDTNALPETGTATGLDERTSTPANLQVRVSKACNNIQPSSLPKPLSYVSRVTPSIAFDACFPNPTMDTNNAANCVADASDFIDLHSSPAAADLVSSRTDAAQDQARIALASLHDDGGTAVIFEAKQVINSAAATPGPPSGVKFTTNTNNQNLHGTSVSSIDSAAQGNTANDYGEFSATMNLTYGSAIEKANTNEEASTQAPENLSTKRSPEGPRAPARFAEAVTEQASKHVVQSSVETAPLPDQPDPSIDQGGSLASAAPGIQTQSQSTVSQTSEPTSSHTVPKLSLQDITLAKLRTQKAALLASLKALPAIQVLIEENKNSDVNMFDDDDEPTEADVAAVANKIVKEHIKLLHEYNELKDVGQGLMGLIADQRGVRIVEIQDEFGIDAND